MERIITRSIVSVESQSWRDHLSHSITRLDELLSLLDLSTDQISKQLQACQSFSLLVPRTFAAQMQPGNPNDPLLRQILPDPQELESPSHFTLDPLAERETNQQAGIIHKYHGRVLLLLATGCAINCRYCFRRHFDYAANRLGRRHWQSMLDYLSDDSSITEVILSGGDPLMHDDHILADFISRLESIPHLKRIRIHSRLPVVIAQRLTQQLAQVLADSRLQPCLVLHINHPNELTDEHRRRISQWRQLGITCLNQTVLLKGVNDSAETLIALSEKLFEYGILPYYLHLLDRVQGAHHFDVEPAVVDELQRQMLSRLPGYLMPKFVRECAGEASKSPVVNPALCR